MAATTKSTRDRRPDVGKMVPEPTPESVDTAPAVPDVDAELDGYPVEYLPCRGDSHEWQRKPVWKLITDAMAERHTICKNCGSTKWRMWNRRRWYPVGRTKYDYAPGYRTRNSGLTRGDFQRRYVSGEFEEAASDGRIEDRIEGESE